MSPLYLTSLYYQNNRVTGANKRFDELGKMHLDSELFDIKVVVQDGQCPSWCPKDKVMYVRSYKSKLERIISWGHLSWLLLCSPKGTLYCDFQPIPLFCGLKHRHYQLIHDLRNWTQFARGGLGKLSSKFQKWQLRQSFKVITVSEYSKNDISLKCSIPSDNIFVSYNGVSEDYCLNENGSARNIDLVYVATYEERKNHLNLLKAIESLSFDVNVCLVGRDLGALPEIMAYIHNSNSNNLRSIKFFESMSERELIHLYQDSKVFISPSFLEGFGMPLIEASACGAKVVCSDIQVFREIMGESAYYFTPDSIDDIRLGIETVLSGSVRTILNTDKFRWPSLARDLEEEFLG